jgi:hypothetical protein
MTELAKWREVYVYLKKFVIFLYAQNQVDAEIRSPERLSPSLGGRILLVVSFSFLLRPRCRGLFVDCPITKCEIMHSYKTPIPNYETPEFVKQQQTEGRARTSIGMLCSLQR